MSPSAATSGVQCVSRAIRIRSGAALKLANHRPTTRTAATETAKKPADWSATQYLKFGDERTRAVHELVARVPLTNPKRVVDLGCGPGNSTAVLHARYPNAKLSGMDSSANMIEKARQTLPDVDFSLGDLQTYEAEGPEPVDLYFSNAVFHWLPNEKRLPAIAKLLETQPSGSVFAFQVPDNFNEPSHVAMREIAATGPWASSEAPEQENPLLDRFPGPRSIYNALKPLSSNVDVWHSYYHHILDDPQSIIEWLKSTGLRPYVDPLSPEHRKEYFKRYLERLETEYPPLCDGKVMLRYPRLFVVAVRQ